MVVGWKDGLSQASLSRTKRKSEESGIEDRKEDVVPPCPSLVWQLGNLIISCYSYCSSYIEYKAEPFNPENSKTNTIFKRNPL